MNLVQDTHSNSLDAFMRCAAAVELGWDVIFVGVDPDLSHPANPAVTRRHGPAGVTWLTWIKCPVEPDDAREILDGRVAKM